MLKLKPNLIMVLAFLVTISPLLADSIWIGRNSGAVQCEGPGRTLEQDRLELDDLGVMTSEACVGSLVGIKYCSACGCPAGIYNFFLIDAADLPVAEEAGWRAFQEGEYRHTTCE